MMQTRRGPAVRKNSIRLPSDRDAGTYLFGFPALGSPKNQSCEQKMLLSQADPVQSLQAMFRFFQNTKRSLDSLLNLITDLVADGLLFFRLLFHSHGPERGGSVPAKATGLL
jgi:hypothetical protein